MGDVLPGDIRIRLVEVEFLRAGPPHNQLLSPLTQYLAIAGDAGAGLVGVPYEHAQFERRLRELRYETGDPADRQGILHDTGVEMAKILGAVPGLPGVLGADPDASGTLVHLRLTLSASELAMLPFELAKLPVSAAASGEGWLSIQTRPPVCITRHVRTVSPEGVNWPERPRILFIAGDPADVPYEAHRSALANAIASFQYPGRDDLARSKDGRREEYGDLLTILVNPSLGDVFAECRRERYTHVHVLTHGDLNETSPDSYGLVLRGGDGAPDVVSGEQFASALTSVSAAGVHRPTVVTLASCDSGNVGTIVIPGASFAHALHQSGVPLVIASQFPLSKEGSAPLAGALYEGLLRGQHPLVLLQQLRAELHARYTAAWHDWASLVAYEALPRSLPRQLDATRYVQSRRALEAALEGVERSLRQPAERRPQPSAFVGLQQGVERALADLPLGGSYAVECIGLRGSARKRLAHALFALRGEPGGAAGSAQDSCDLLEEAWSDYEHAARALLTNEATSVQRRATLHWVLVQFVSLSVVLAKPIDERHWSAAALSADLHREHGGAEELAWAHASLAELWLLRLAEPGPTLEQRRQFAAEAIRHAQELARLGFRAGDFPLLSTRRQFDRYVEWWGTPRFEEELSARGLKRPVSWDGESGLLETAKRAIATLQRRSPAAAPGKDDAQQQVDSSPTSPAVTDSAAPVPASSLPAPGPRGDGAPFFRIEMLPAGHGDCLWIEYGQGRDVHRWLVDCGTHSTSRALLRRVEAVPERERLLELFVMSHIDSDHIGGALPFFKAVRRGLKFGDVWFNGWRQLSGTLGARQGEMFSTALEELKLPWNEWRRGGAIVGDKDSLPEITLPGGMKLTLLSPRAAELRKLGPVWVRELRKYGLAPGTRVDYSRFLKGKPSSSTDVNALAEEPFEGDGGIPNGTSIALLAEFSGVSALLTADAHAPVLVDAIRALNARRGTDRLKIDAFKVSHHASQNNVSAELIQLLDCRRYLVSTNGNHFCHPDRQAIARILKYGGPKPVLHFNYRSAYNEVWAREDLQEKYRYTATYPDADRAGTAVSLFEKE